MPPDSPSLPAVAVVIPTYNRWPHVVHAVDSALGQCHPRVEVVVVDDGSTDPTARMMRQRYEDRITLIRLGRNIEKSRARNEGIRAATAEFVCMLDSDDLLLPGGIARRLRIFLDDPSFDGVAYGASRRGGTRHTVHGRYPSGDILHRYLDRPGLLDNNAFLLRRATMLRHGMYHESMTNMEDREMLIRLTARLPFRYCGAETQRIRRVDASARINYRAILRQGRALTAALRTVPDVMERIGPRFHEVEYMEDHELARALYKLRRYRHYTAAIGHMRGKYPDRLRADPHVRRRMIVARILQHFVHGERCR